MNSPFAKQRYYFDMLDGENASFDEDGMELPDIQSVQEEAALALAALAKGAARCSGVGYSLRSRSRSPRRRRAGAESPVHTVLGRITIGRGSTMAATSD